MSAAAFPSTGASPALLARLFRWDAWANREALASLRATPRPPERAVRVIAHLAGASWLWLSRIQDEPSPIAVWPALGLAGAAEELDAVSDAWGAYLARLAPPALERTISYTN